MTKIHVEVLSEKEIEAIHAGTMQILRDTGVMVHHDEALELLRQAGAEVQRDKKIARLGERLVMESIERSGKKYILYGRNPERTARFGYGDFVLMSSHEPELMEGGLADEVDSIVQTAEREIG